MFHFRQHKTTDDEDKDNVYNKIICRYCVHLCAIVYGLCHNVQFNCAQLWQLVCCDMAWAVTL